MCPRLCGEARKAGSSSGHPSPAAHTLSPGGVRSSGWDRAGTGLGPQCWDVPGFTLSCFSQDGDFSFSLESVKKLKDLQEAPESKVQGRRKFVAPPLCSFSGFPEELRPVCKEPNSQDILNRLGERAGIFWQLLGKRCTLIGGVWRGSILIGGYVEHSLDES